MKTKALFASAIVIGLCACAAIADESTGGRPLSATLTGSDEVPGPGDPDAQGTARITLNPGQEEVCFKLSVSNMGPATVAHIHSGAVGSSGPPVVTLSPAPTDGQSGGCVSAERDLIQEILRDPTGYYVNVHNQEFPNGAVRGQLAK